MITSDGDIFAASVVAVAPIAVLVLIVRRSVESGFAAGAVQGYILQCPGYAAPAAVSRLPSRP